MAHLHEVTDADVQFLIDKNKNITNETELRELIQFDHNSERYSFRMPKMIEGHDMATCNVIQIHYFNVDASSKAKNIGVYEVTDLKACEDDADMLTFSWLISQNGTQLVGNIHFLVRFSCVTDGVIDYAWNTKIHKATKVGTGIYNSGELVEEYADVLQQWKEQLFVEEVIDWKNVTNKPFTETEAGEKLNMSCIPDELYTKIDERIDSYINEALGGDY